MSFSSALVAVIVSVVTSILGGIILGVIEERYDGISLNLLRLAARLQPPDEREEFINEALGNLSRLDGQYRIMTHAFGLLFASIRIRHVWRREMATMDHFLATLRVKKVTITILMWNKWIRYLFLIGYTSREPMNRSAHYAADLIDELRNR